MKDIEPLQLHRLKTLSRTPQPKEVKELLWEIKRLHLVLQQLKDGTDVVKRQWHDEIGGNLVALEQMRILLANEPGAAKIAYDPDAVLAKKAGNKKAPIL